MDKRTVEFIRALRAAGVRISIAESEDALRGVDLIGIGERETFKSTLQATLVKEHSDRQLFEFFFPLFFDNNAPPMWDVSQQLTPEQQDLLERAMQSMMGDMDAWKDLLEQLMEGKQFTREELEQMAQQAGISNAQHMYQQRYFSRQIERQLGMQEMREIIEEILEQLRAMGMSEEALEDIVEMLEDNMGALREQIANYVGSSIAQNLAEQERPPVQDVQDLPFQHLSPEEAEQVREEMRRLAARLRSRASLRQKRSKTGTVDPKRTIRANLKYGGIPLELRHRTKHVKPKIVVVCDLSGSMRYMSEFMLTLTYMLQDLVTKARSFVFIDDMVEVTDHFKQTRPIEAVEKVLRDNPRGYYSTDLGHSLDTFSSKFMDSIDSKTSVIFVGDGRNNYNNPRLDIAEQIGRIARRCIWFCPEPEYQWGTGDSDMQRYAPLSDGVFLVRNLRELSIAIDNILTDGN